MKCPARIHHPASLLALLALATLLTLTACLPAPPADDGGDGAEEATTAASEEPSATRPPALALDAYDLVDLTWPFGEDTVYWPTAPTGFELEELAYGEVEGDETEGGYFYSAYAYRAPEHGGTHLDAPVHFYEGRHTAEEIPLEQLMGPAVVIDVAEKAAEDPDYRLQEEDVTAWEQEHGDVPPGSIVLLRTGWGERWPDRAAYLGDDTPGDASNLHFPSYGEEAAKLLVLGRGVAVLGVDTASIDYGQSKDFRVHRVAAEANVPGLENVARLEELPATGAWVMALPMKIAGGSGGPVRIVAMVPR